MQNILIIDDEPKVCELISLYFKAEGFRVFEAYTAKSAFEIFKENSIDLIILDVMMPELSGFDQCKIFRQTSNVPIIFLSSLKEDENVIDGLECGADDYIIKVTNPKIIVAKAKKILSRVNKPTETISILGIILDKSGHSVCVDGKYVNFTNKEYDLLLLLAENQNKVLTRDIILDKIWGYEFTGQTRVVDSHIKKIRKKLGPYADIITTIISVGYKLEVK